MLERQKNSSKKPVLILSDVPIKSEIIGQTELVDDQVVLYHSPWSASSNLNMLTSLRTGKVSPHSRDNPDFKGIVSTKIHKTYLDYSYYGEIEGNFDFNKEIVRGKDRIEGEKYVEVPVHKNLFVSERLYNEFQALLSEIKKVNPKLIIVTGKWSLFFLTLLPGFGETMSTVKAKKPLGSLVKFRASLMNIHEAWGDVGQRIVFPLWHTINAIAMPDKVPVMEADLYKVGYVYNTISEKGVEYFKQSEKNIILGLSLDIIKDYVSKVTFQLSQKKTLLSVDVETMQHTFIDCIGIAISKDEGICIPFATIDNPNFWTREEELEVLFLIKQVLEHPNARLLGQNFSYDCQYFLKNWGISVQASEDTMILAHILYNHLPKDLAFLASIYCEFYCYWKDNITATKETPEQRWRYNVADILYTMEIFESINEILKSETKKLQDLYRFTIDDLCPELVSTMNFGVAVDNKLKEEYREFFQGLLDKIKIRINEMLGFEFNLNSTPQKKKLFKDFFQMELKVRKRKGVADSETTDSQAMIEYVEEYPLLRPILSLMLEYNAIKVFTRTFLMMQLDDDGRMRTQYHVAKVKTGRLASTKNVWKKGGNLANLPSGGKLPLMYALEVLNEKVEEKVEQEEWNKFLEGIVDSEEEEFEVEV